MAAYSHCNIDMHGVRCDSVIAYLFK